MHFSDEQKARIDTLIENRLHKERRRHSIELAAMADERDSARAEVQALIDERDDLRRQLAAVREALVQQPPPAPPPDRERFADKLRRWIASP
jgi:uncharacterized coiled-coil DUF342 family protein